MTRFLLITTGGTIDAQAYRIENTPYNITPLAQSLVPDALVKVGIKRFEYKPLPPADSKQFLANGNGLNLLIDEINSAKQKHILITHGTDALCITAVAIYEALKAANSDKRVVFSCAMVPLANGEHSDGYANLRLAVDELRKPNLAAGVYIAANEGKFFEGNGLLPRIRKEFNAPSPDKRFFYIED